MREVGGANGAVGELCEKREGLLELLESCARRGRSYWSRRRAVGEEGGATGAVGEEGGATGALGEEGGAIGALGELCQKREGLMEL